MKKFLMLSLLFISGCVAIPQYDNNEYLYFTQIKSGLLDAKAGCGGKIDISDVYGKSKTITVYTEMPDVNEEINKSSKIILGMVTELKTRYEKEIPSKTYCETKIDNIIEAVDIVRTNIVGRRGTNGIFN